MGRLPGIYSLYLGGNWEGTRLNKLVFEKIKFNEIPEVLDVLFKFYKKNQKPNELFGDFCHRSGLKELKKRVLEGFPSLI